MAKYSKQMIELQAWQDFELEYLIEPEPELDLYYAGIIQGEDYIPTEEDEVYISINDYGYVDFYKYANNIEDYLYSYDD